MAERTNFPWLMSNVEDNETESPLAGGILAHTINWHGWKIGLVSCMAIRVHLFISYQNVCSAKEEPLHTCSVRLSQDTYLDTHKG